MIQFRKYINRTLVDICSFLKIQPKYLYPYNLIIEPTNICNFHCPLCPTGKGNLKQKKGFMDYNLFKTIIDELSPYLFQARLWGFGEPLLHSQIFDMIDYLENRHIKTFISTNASILEKEDFAEKIVNSKLSVLIIALDGASQETYSKYRVGGNFENVIHSIKYIKKQKKIIKKKLPKIKLQFIVMRHNEHEIDKIKTISETLGIYLKIKTVSILHEDEIGYLPTNTDYSRYKTNIAIQPSIPQPRACPYVWSWATITWDGDVVSCCKDPHRTNLMGTVISDTFQNIWRSEKFINFRKSLLLNRDSIKRCKNCVLPIRVNK